jgi:hypothetical protein
MNRLVVKRYLVFLVIACLFSPACFSQQVTGIWRGYFIAHDGYQYRLEFQVKQTSKGTVAVSGVSYSWQDDKRFYGKATMTGSYISNTQNFRIREIKTVEVTNPLGGSTCIMNYDLRYSKSGSEEYLEGTYLGKPEVKGAKNPYEWGECGYGKVFLRRVVSSDFYVEPFLRDKPASPRTDLHPPVVKKDASKTTPPVVKKTTPTNPPTTGTTKKNTTKTNTTGTTAKSAPPPELKKADSIPVIDKGPIKQRPIVVPTPSVLKTRENALMKSLVVSSADVTVKLYDNGEIDGDTISVYLDKKLVLSKKLLTTAPLTITLKMDTDNPDHELIMVAENLGRIPPNTSLMIVEAGDQRFDVRITSTEQKNALVRFRYEPK